MNIVDSIRSYFSPTAALDIEQKRAAVDVIRGYNATKNGRLSHGSPRTSQRSNLSHANKALSFDAQDIDRNHPLGKKIKRLFANSIVGSGISATLKGSNKKAVESEQVMFEEWAESTDCDFQGQLNLDGILWLAVATIAVSGGVFIRYIFDKNVDEGVVPLKLQILDQTYLDDRKSLPRASSGNGSYIIDGVQYLNNGIVEGYWLKESTDTLAGGLNALKSTFYSRDEVRFIYDMEFADQHVGVSLVSVVSALLRDRDEYKDAKLVQQKVAACFATFVIGSEDTLGIEKDEDDERTEYIEPAAVHYANSGTEIKTVTPPKADNATSFEIGIDRDLSAGAGFTYEQITGDYSQVNFASGRMGRAEFNNQLDHWQLHMMLPALNDLFKRYKVARLLMSGNSRIRPIKVEWTFPARSTVNPKEELDVDIAKVRSGILSPTKFAKKHGDKLTTVMAQWKKDQELMDKHGLKFDIDPRYFSAAGNQLNEDDAASANATGSTTKQDDEK